MKTIIAGLLLTASQICLAQQSLIVMGDSITSSPTSWPSGLRAAGHVVRDLTQGGRQTREYEIPRDLSPINASKVLFALGTNDAYVIDQAAPGFAKFIAQGMYNERFNSHMDMLDNKGFIVTLIVPARYSHYGNGIDYVRSTMLSHCAMTGKTCVDSQAFWDENETLLVDGIPDKIHPNPTLTAVLVSTIGGVL